MYNTHLFDERRFAGLARACVSEDCKVKCGIKLNSETKQFPTKRAIRPVPPVTGGSAAPPRTPYIHSVSQRWWSTLLISKNVAVPASRNELQLQLQ